RVGEGRLGVIGRALGVEVHDLAVGQGEGVVDVAARAAARLIGRADGGAGDSGAVARHADRGGGRGGVVGRAGDAALVHGAVAVVVEAVAAGLGSGEDLAGAGGVRAADAGRGAAAADADARGAGRAGVKHHRRQALVRSSVAVVVDAVAGLGRRHARR